MDLSTTPPSGGFGRDDRPHQPSTCSQRFNIFNLFIRSWPKTKTSDKAFHLVTLNFIFHDGGFMNTHIKYIAFDADDTLWDNEPFYRDLEHLFNSLLLDRMNAEESSAELFKTEVANLPLYGFGAKAYTLSILETALRLTDDTIPVASLKKILEKGKALTDSPLILLDHVEDALKVLSQKYKLILATKGDLLDQERKLKKSGLEI
jgi:hypothetical protein